MTKTKQHFAMKIKGIHLNPYSSPASSDKLLKVTPLEEVQFNADSGAVVVFKIKDKMEEIRFFDRNHDGFLTSDVGERAFKAEFQEIPYTVALWRGKLYWVWADPNSKEKDKWIAMEEFATLSKQSKTLALTARYFRVFVPNQSLMDLLSRDASYKDLYQSLEIHLQVDPDDLGNHRTLEVSRTKGNDPFTAVVLTTDQYMAPSSK